MNINATQFHHVEVDVSTIIERIDRLIGGWSDEDLIAQVQMLAQELGRTPTRDEFDKDMRTATSTTIHSHFHCSWNKFLEIAGLKVNFRRGISDEELISQVQMLAQELGKSPTAKEFNQSPKTASATMVFSRFNCSWNKFLEKAGLETNYKRARNEI